MNKIYELLLTIRNDVLELKLNHVQQNLEQKNEILQLKNTVATIEKSLQE